MPACSFCGENVSKGTGKIYVKKDGKRLDFCSSKCEKNMIILKKNPRKYKWSAFYDAAVKKDRVKEVETKEVEE